MPTAKNSNPAPGHELVRRTNDYVAASWRNVLVMVWARKVTADGVRIGAELTDSLLRKYPPGVVSVSIAFPGIPLPDSEARAVSSKAMRETVQGAILLNMAVIEGGGFWAAGARAAIAGIIALSGVRRTVKVVATVEEAGPLIAPFVDRRDLIGPSEPGHVVEALNAIRAEA